MKPLKLVISAFGPYKDRVEIDFRKFGEDGIFLIIGDTGSGKTTIFDAISFALFGTASGSRRENGSFRSDFANDDVKTFVELEFLHKDVIYLVSRTPKYSRKKKRGTGVTVVGGDATLTYLDEVVTGDKSVTDKCIEILGMSANQFKQIVMIAQGEFLDLLLAKTKDRATIFRNIFDTYIYKNISDCLKDKYLNKRREYDDMSLSIKSFIHGIVLDSDFSGNESTEDVLRLLEKEIAKDIELDVNLEEKRSLLVKESNKIIEIISEGKIINDNILSLNKLKKELDELMEMNSQIVAKENLVKKNKDIWDKIMPKYLEMINLEKELLSKKENLKSTSSLYEVSLKNYNDILIKYQDIEFLLKRIQELSYDNEKLEEKLSLFDEISLLNQELDVYYQKFNYCNFIKNKNLLMKFDDYIVKEKEIDSLRKKIIFRKDSYVKGNELYISHYNLFLSAQAGILASNLEEGQACPVCGSIHHPDLAKSVYEVLSKEELDLEKSNLESKYQELETLRFDLLNKEKDLELLKEEIRGIDRDKLCKEIDNLQSNCKDVDFDIKELDVLKIESNIQKLEIKIQEKKDNLDDSDKDELRSKIDKNKEKVLRLEEDINNIKNNYNKLLEDKTKLESLKSVLEEDIFNLENSYIKVKDEYISSYISLGYIDEEEYIRVKLEHDELDKLKVEVQNYRDNILKLKSNISSFEELTEGRESILLDSYEERLSIINKKLDSINLSLKDINSKISNNKKVFMSIKDVSEKMTKLEKEVMIYKDLSDTANGNITGKNKLEFEQFVQASYFDMVLISANKRFCYMTEDRYQLVRKDEALKISDKLGLELEVMDYYTGKRRDVKSLSGGESFKAALSLALGMSDVIQEFSGGVVVDAMFIDEGFGSLDDDSLEVALNAIMKLSCDNRLIGIISHVNELKNRIDKKIVVNKSNSGSIVNFVV